MMTIIELLNKWKLMCWERQEDSDIKSCMVVSPAVSVKANEKGNEKVLSRIEHSYIHLVITNVHR